MTTIHLHRRNIRTTKHTIMKKIVFFITICLNTFSYSVQAKTNNTETVQSPIKRVTLDTELTINLYNNNGEFIKMTTPEINGNFHFGNITPGRYSIIVANSNGIKSEAYFVSSNKQEISTNLNEVVNPNNLAYNNKSLVEIHTKKNQSSFKLSISNSPLRGRGDLKFHLENKSDVKISIINKNQSIIYTLPLGEIESGTHSINLDIANLTGEYSILVQAETEVSTCQISVQ